jgi:hypothetical protein
MLMNFATNLWHFLVGAFIIFLFVMWIWLLVRVLADVFRRSDISGLGKVVWIIFLFVLPYLGVFAYLLTQGRSMSERDTEAALATRDQLRSAIGFSVADELAKLEGLKAEGKISADEYNKLRARLV